jgi:hypothetical protein
LILLGRTILAGGYPFDSGILAAIYCGFILLRVIHFWVPGIYLILQLKLSFHHIPKYLRAHRAPGSGLRAGFDRVAGCRGSVGGNCLFFRTRDAMHLKLRWIANVDKFDNNC